MQVTVTEVVEIGLEMLDQTDEFLQTSLWGMFKAAFGWKAQGFQARFDTPKGSHETTFLVLTRRVAGPFYLAYVPFGPPWEADQGFESLGKLLSELGRHLKEFLPRPFLGVRWDLPQAFPQPLKALPPLWRGAKVQPPDTVWIDLTKPEKRLLEEMERGHRYNVGYAERKGVIITEGETESVSRWFSLFRDTAKRDGFSGHGQEYYQTLIDLARGYKGTGRLGCRVFFAEHGGDTLAGAIIAFANKTATYLFGASSNNKRNLKPVYLLLWRVMQVAKAVGCERLDMFGIPPDNNPSHPLAGLYDFKRNFGGGIVHRGGSWDVPLHPLYPMFRWLEKFKTPKKRRVRSF